MEPDNLERIHQGLMAGEPTASRALVHACTRPLLTLLRPSFALLPRECVEDAIHDALLVLICRPALYQPECGTVLSLLAGIARKKLIDQCRRLRRVRETPVGGTVELEVLATNHMSEPEFSEDRMQEVEALLAQILPDPVDRALFRMVCEGRTAVADFARLLGLDDLPVAEMKKHVKRRRDRVVRKVRYHREEFRRHLL